MSKFMKSEFTKHVLLALFTSLVLWGLIIFGCYLALDALIN